MLYLTIMLMMLVLNSQTSMMASIEKTESDASTSVVQTIQQ